VFSLIWLKKTALGISGSTMHSLKDIVNEFKPNPTKIIDRKEEIAQEKNENLFFQSLFERNLNIIQKTNLEIPDCLDVCIKQNDLKDLKGLRALIPYLGNENHVHIRFNISNNLSQALMNLGEDKPLASNEFYRWVNNFTERLSILRIKAATVYERLLPQDLMNKLKRVPESELLEAAKEINQTMVWKIVFEILPEEKSQFLVSQLDEKSMQMIFKNENLRKSDLIDQANRLLAACERIGSRISSNVDMGLLKPIMSILELKKPGEDDTYLQSLSIYSADIIPLVQANLWTSKKITEIPEDMLLDKFMSLDIDQKKDIILGFKDVYGDLFLSFVKDAKLKRILEDEGQSTMNVGSQRTKQAYKTCRTFLADLKRDYDQGKFEIIKAA
jgi:hypothetical protein